MNEDRLQSIPLFARLGRDERRMVARLADELDIPAGHRLVAEGRFAHEFFVILDGGATVTVGDRTVAELGPGDFLGEMGSLARSRRNATVTATSPMTVVVMTARDLRTIDEDMPHVHDQLRAAVESRGAALAG